MIPVVLSGGVGSRLWPLSRSMYPKQLIPLVDPELSMLQQTVQRASGIDGVMPPLIVCNDEHRFMVGEQMQKIDVDDATILLETTARNTAPAIALAAFSALQNDPDALLLVMPADHVMTDVAAFQGAVAIAKEHALQGRIVTFGIVPTHPETGYGYIRADLEPTAGGYPVLEFKEKPDLQGAEQYLKDGSYYWNGGIFLFRADVLLQELKAYEPLVYQAAEQAIIGAQSDLDFLRIDGESFAQSPSISIDYALMERTDKAMMVPLDAGWNDLGSWAALWDVSEKDSHGNAVTGQVLLHNTVNSHIYAQSKLVALVGVDNLIVAETEDAVLVVDRDSAQDVKSIVEQIERMDLTQHAHHRKVYRPWGWYDPVDVGTNFQVKRIQVSPGAKLSVQMHHHRAEHWVVVKGVAAVRKGDDEFLLNENQSTYIPIGVIHSLANPSDTESLQIIEVQSGDYLGEDDIIRFEDQYGRK